MPKHRLGETPWKPCETWEILVRQRHTLAANNPWSKFSLGRTKDIEGYVYLGIWGCQKKLKIKSNPQRRPRIQATGVSPHFSSGLYTKYGLLPRNNVSYSQYGPLLGLNHITAPNISGYKNGTLILGTAHVLHKGKPFPDGIPEALCRTPSL